MAKGKKGMLFLILALGGGLLFYFLWLRKRANQFNSVEVQAAVANKNYLDSLSEDDKKSVTGATLSPTEAEQIASITHKKLKGWRTRDDKVEIERQAEKVKNIADVNLVQGFFGTFKGKNYYQCLERFLPNGTAIVEQIRDMIIESA